MGKYDFLLKNGTRHIKLLAAMFCTGAGCIAAHGAGALPFEGYWETRTLRGVSEVLCENGCITGIVAANPSEKNPQAAFDHTLIVPQSGDFVATANMVLDFDEAFVGDVLLQFLDDQDGLIAQCGILDRWNAGHARISGSTLLGGGSQNLRNTAVKGTMPIRIERKGRTITVNGMNTKVFEAQGNLNAVAKVRVYISEIKGSEPCRYAFKFTDINVQSTSMDMRGDVFDETPVNSLSPEWKVVQRRGIGGLKFAQDTPYLTVTGFENINPGEKAIYYWNYDRNIAPLSGDFTATFDLQWDFSKDMHFSGDVMIQLYGAQDKLIAEAGIWDAAPNSYARAGGWVGEGRKGGAMFLSCKAQNPFIIRRTGDQIDIFCGAWQLEGLKGSTEPVTKVRLVFRHYLHIPKDWEVSQSHYRGVSIRRIALASRALPTPELKVKPIKRTGTTWEIGEPIVWYWAGPELTDEFARELVDGGWNTAWGSTVDDLDLMYRHGLRGVLWMSIDPGSPDNERRLKFWLESVRNHPALYGVHCNDEPGGPRMPAAELKVNFMRANAPEVLHFNNMHPFGAENYHLGHEGKPVDAYLAYIDEYCTKLYAQILSYDKYHFAPYGEDPSYWTNLALVRKEALKRNIPMMTIVQSCSWATWRRPVRPEEFRFLAYNALAYSSQALSCYVYGTQKHWGSMCDPDSLETTKLYEAARNINREFYAIASELQKLTSLGVYHTGDIPFGTDELTSNGIFQIEPRLKNVPHPAQNADNRKPDGTNVFSNYPPVKGYVLGYFGTDGKPTHVLLVNLDYNASVKTTMTAPEALEYFEPGMKRWLDAKGNSFEVELPPGGGKLFRLKSAR